MMLRYGLLASLLTTLTLLASSAGVAFAQQIINFRLEPVGGSGISSTATVTAAGGQSDPATLSVEAHGLSAGQSFPVHLHAGTCAQPSASTGFLGALVVDQSGRGTLAVNSVTVGGASIPLNLGLLADGDHIVELHGQTTLACGAIPSAATAPGTRDERYFAATGYRIDNNVFWDYFNKRGGLRTFGYPVSRTFRFLGFTTQFFQRQILQLASDGSARTLNILDPGLVPHTTINGATFPAPDPAIISQAPAPGTAGYDIAVQDFVRRFAPDQFGGHNTNYYRTYLNTVTLHDAFPSGGGSASLLPGLNLEMWGVPTSAPMGDPRNLNFIYLRFQRGVMHFDARKQVTEGLLLADYLKSILTGTNLPADLEAQANTSRFYKQYNPAKAQWIDRPAELPDTDLTNAFEVQ